MFEGIKKRIGAFVLKKELESQHRKVIAKNIVNVNKVGIVFNAEEESIYKEVKQYVKYLKEEGVKVVKVMGYVDSKVIPFHLQPSLDFNFICNNDVNWYYRPLGTDVVNFSTEDFDVLVDLTTKKSYTSKFLFGITAARLKIGKYNEKDELFYDLMIDITEGKSMKYFTQQVNHYLSMINKPQTNV
jgi:hypothetical protein